MDFSNLRLTDDSEILEYHKKMGKDFWTFANKVYTGLSERDTFDVSEVKEKSRDLFVKVVCWLIQDGHLSAYFNEQFTKITILKTV